MAGARAVTGSPIIDLRAFASPDRVIVLPGAPGKRAVIAALIECLASHPGLGDRATFARAIADREDVTSTAVGGGIAIPHARLDGIRDFLLAIAIVPGGCEFAAQDRNPVDLVVMLAAPARDHHAYLRVLASIASRLRQSAVHQAMVDARDAAELVRAFTGG